MEGKRRKDTITPRPHPTCKQQLLPDTVADEVKVNVKVEVEVASSGRQAGKVQSHSQVKQSLIPSSPSARSLGQQRDEVAAYRNKEGSTVQMDALTFDVFFFLSIVLPCPTGNCTTRPESTTNAAFGS